jgi:iron complex transport system ATP-binding protein
VLQFAFTALEVVLMGRSPHVRGGEGDRDLAIAETAMVRTDCLHLAGRSYPTLSTGEQQRVTLARVLAQETPVLLLDEPTASLDVRHQELVMRTVRPCLPCCTTSTSLPRTPTASRSSPAAGSRR